MIENIIVNSSDWLESDIEILFEDEAVHFTDRTDLPGLLVELGIFKSTSEARRANRQGPIPAGFTDGFKASKKRKLWIWNPKD